MSIPVEEELVVKCDWWKFKGEYPDIEAHAADENGVMWTACCFIFADLDCQPGGPSIGNPPRIWVDGPGGVEGTLAHDYRTITVWPYYQKAYRDRVSALQPEQCQPTATATLFDRNDLSNLGFVWP